VTKNKLFYEGVGEGDEIEKRKVTGNKEKGTVHTGYKEHVVRI
jgi:hypothetical protein